MSTEEFLGHQRLPLEETQVEEVFKVGEILSKYFQRGDCTFATYVAISYGIVLGKRIERARKRTREEKAV